MPSPDVEPRGGDRQDVTPNKRHPRRRLAVAALTGVAVVLFTAAAMPRDEAPGTCEAPVAVGTLPPPTMAPETTTTLMTREASIQYHRGLEAMSQSLIFDQQLEAEATVDNIADAEIHKKVNLAVDRAQGSVAARLATTDNNEAFARMVASLVENDDVERQTNEAIDAAAAEEALLGSGQPVEVWAAAHDQATAQADALYTAAEHDWRELRMLAAVDK